MPFKTPSVIRDKLIPELFVNAALLNPDHAFAYILDDDEVGIPLKRISFQQYLAHSLNVAKKLSKEIPIRTRGGPIRVISVYARSNYSYAVHWLAIQLNGWTACLISTKNSPDACRHLLNISHSAHLLVEEQYLPYTQSLESGVHIVPFQELVYTNPLSKVETLTFTKEQRERDLDLPAFYLHTSGSTGHPKIISLTHRIMSQWTSSTLFTCPNFRDQPVYCVSPLFHALGAYTCFLNSPSGGISSLFVDMKRPLNGEAVLRHLTAYRNFLKTTTEYKDRKIVLISVPSLLDDIATAGEKSISLLSELTSGAIYSGANLADSIGENLVQGGVNIRSLYGMTEVGLTCVLDLEDGPRLNGGWRYIQWRKGLNMIMMGTSERNVKELVIQPDVDSPAVIDHANPTGFMTKDLWTQHPRKPYLWKHMGRAGDVTVLSNGEKTNNKQLQTILERDKNIEHAVVFGSGRPQNGVILSPTTPSMSAKQFLDDIWPTILELNKVVPKHSRLTRELVLVEDPKRPFAVTDKHTVREKITLELYKVDIEKAYEELEMNQDPEISLPDNYDAKTLTEFLRATFGMMIPEGAPDNDADMFEHGMDSLFAVRLRSLIIKLAKKASASTDIPKNIIYHHPTINGLVGFLTSHLSPSQSGGVGAGVQERINKSIKRFTAGFMPRAVKQGLTPLEEGEFVAVTGTTGSLGSFIVSMLLERPSVQRVYCLNRKGSTSSIERQIHGLVERGLDATPLEKAIGDRVMFFDVDFSHPKLGLAEEAYEELRVKLTHIIHSAWQLNFNLILESFEKVHVAGTRHLINLALASPRKKCPRFVFLSSIASVILFSSGSHLPETSVQDAHFANGGYGMSKFVSERICDVAVKEAGLNATIVRIGQISGASQSGAWAASEYMPILFRSSFALGCVPVDLPPVRWIPTDVAAQVVIKQTFTSAGESNPILYYNLENPHTTPWKDISDVLCKYKSTNLEKVTMAQWLEKVRQHGVEDAEHVPAVRLVEFYEHMDDALPMGVDKALVVTPELNYGPIGEKLLTRYLQYQHI